MTDRPRESASVCIKCGNDGTQGGLYIAIDARWSPEKKCWILEVRDDQGGRVLDCTACDHNEPEPEFPYGYEVQHEHR